MDACAHEEGWLQRYVRRKPSTEDLPRSVEDRAARAYKDVASVEPRDAQPENRRSNVVRPWVAWKLNADDLQTVCFPRRPDGGQAVRQICAVEKITHGRRKLEGTGAGEEFSGKRCLESRSSWRGAE